MKDNSESRTDRIGSPPDRHGVDTCRVGGGEGFSRRFGAGRKLAPVERGGNV